MCGPGVGGPCEADSGSCPGQVMCTADSSYGTCVTSTCVGGCSFGCPR